MNKILDLDTGEEIPAPDYGGGFNAVLQKRDSFEHEKELRCIFWEPHIRSKKINLTCQDISSGHYIQEELDCLIEEVYVALNAGTWFRELTESTIKKNGYSFKLSNSRLSEEPVF